MFKELFQILKRRNILRILFGVVALLILLRVFLTLLAEPLLREKIISELNKTNGDFVVDINKVHITLITSCIELVRIKVHPGRKNGGYSIITVEEVEELNSILEKNAFLYDTSGKIDGLKFSFTANNSYASGKMTMFYHGLNITIKNKRTDDTTAFKEILFSLIANAKVLDSNPIRREQVRTGIIDYKVTLKDFFFIIVSGLSCQGLHLPC